MEKSNMEENTFTESRKKIHLNAKQNGSLFRRGPDYYVLWVMVLLLLAFNLFLAWSLLAARQQIETFRQNFEAHLGQVGTIFDGIKGGTFEYVANIDQTIPFSVNVPVDYEVEVPIKMVIPINTTVSVPLLGSGGPTVDVPISTTVPINTTVKVPIKMNIPFSTEIPIKMSVPISIKVSDTFLATALDETKALLDQMTLDFGGFLQDFLKLPQSGASQIIGTATP
jgi:hypothetical protein